MGLFKEKPAASARTPRPVRTRDPITGRPAEVVAADMSKKNLGRPGPEWFFSGNACEGGRGGWVRRT